MSNKEFTCELCICGNISYLSTAVRSSLRINCADHFKRSVSNIYESASGKLLVLT